MAELAVERPDAAPPAAPLVEIAHHQYGPGGIYRRNPAIAAIATGERAEQTLGLGAALAAAQAEMSRHHPEPVASGIEIDVERAARRVTIDAEVDVAHGQHGKACQDSVAESAALVGPLRQGDRTQPGLLRQKRALVGQIRSVAVCHDLLQADDIGAELAQHRRDARRIVAPIGPDAGVDVVGRDDKARPGLLGYPDLGRGDRARAPPGDALERFPPPFGDGAQAFFHVPYPGRPRTQATRSALPCPAAGTGLAVL